MFSAYMKEVNLKNFIIFNFFTYTSLSGPTFACARTHAHAHNKHTHIILPPHFTKNISLPTTRNSSHSTF
jgi:hypothetical protein